MVVLGLEVELILDVDAIFDQFLAEPSLRFKWEAVGGPPAASHCDVGIIDHQSVVVRAVEAIVDRGAKLIRQVIFLLRGGIEDSIAEGEFKFPGDKVFSTLDI